MKKVLLMILDGWGKGNNGASDVIANANVPFISGLYNSAANSELSCSGEEVGLPKGQMGNSEVGHLNIGAGRIMYQDFVRINKAIEDNSISQNKELVDAYAYAKKNDKAVHLIGLLSDGGVHSHINHLKKLCDVAKENMLDNVYVHALMDGRDTDPRSGIGYIKDLQAYLKTTTAQIASICGRYYTMDRDNRWERIKIGYDLLVKGKGEFYTDAITAIQDSYKDGVTDEFVKPIAIVDEENNPKGIINEGDVVICFNFRTDRLREITSVLSQKNNVKHDMTTIPLYYVTMARYDESFKNIHILFDKEDVNETLGEIVSAAGKKQLRIAETEKYAHVTFFFSGGGEKCFDGEERVLIHSPKVATYDLKPAMSAIEVKDAVIKELDKNIFDFVCLNFANADMVGHTGIYEAITEAVETVDTCVEEVVKTAQKNDYSVMIIADHGNADYAVNPDGSPNTAHSNNSVPCILIDKDYENIRNGRLCDVAPTILKIMGIEKPNVMTGNELI